VRSDARKSCASCRRAAQALQQWSFHQPEGKRYALGLASGSIRERGMTHRQKENSGRFYNPPLWDGDTFFDLNSKHWFRPDIAALFEKSLRVETEHQGTP
jgi:predicted Fe-S protein YdhL (DUF1289 family)